MTNIYIKLIEFSKLLKQHIRKIDTVGRWGGEEFLIICPNTDKNGAYRLAGTLKNIIENHAFGVDEKIVIESDDALYDAKKQGRNQIKIY